MKPLAYDVFAVAYLQSHPLYLALGMRWFGPLVQWLCARQMMAAWRRYERVNALRSMR